IPDACDVCQGFDDAIDTDYDDVPNGCDLCEGHSDNDDADGDGIPDGCDICEGHDDKEDADGDGIPDACDVCPGSDDLVDTDWDGIPDACDNCPEVANPDQDDSDSDGVGDACEDNSSSGAPVITDSCVGVTHGGSTIVITICIKFIGVIYSGYTIEFTVVKGVGTPETVTINAFGGEKCAELNISELGDYNWSATLWNPDGTFTTVSGHIIVDENDQSCEY
ncbi:MAG: thrombospondin type 3 repeat-containing protein, partial [Candidatus Neomarinimicrobiota bacterium]